jgi:hypothetical protein
VSTISTVVEAALYSLIMVSRKPEAKAFKRWVVHEVLPSIRKTGSYSAAPKTNSEMLLLYAQQLLEMERRQAEQERIQAERADCIHRVEAKQQAFEESFRYFSVMDYANYRGFPDLTLAEAQKIGRRRAPLSRERGVAVDKARDNRYGYANQYHEAILEEVFQELMNEI